ncbi:MAG TPA: HU family DNA-binding protein [Prevotella sp.]|nr:HU family DNA-binding protein [Prevotella sp.]
MSKSNISRLAKSISSKHGLTQAEAERFISKMFEVANEGLHEDKLLKIKWLGTFKVTPVKDRESVDVNTGERIVIEGRDKISFTPDNILKEIVNKPFAQFETVVVNDGVDFSDIDEKFSLQAVPAEPIAAEMPSTIGEQKTAEASIGQPESKSFDESKNTDEQKVADQPTAEVYPSAEAQPMVVGQPMAEEQQMQPLVGNTTGEQESLINEDILTKESSLVKNASDNKAGTSNEAVASNNAAMSDGAVPSEEPAAEVGEEVHSHHLMIPMYLVAIVCLVFVILLGGMGWFAFNFGKMQAQRDQLAMQLQTIKKPTPVATKDSTQTSAEDSAALALKKKAQEDSIRMAETSKAVEMAEKTEQGRVEGQALTNTSSSQIGTSSKEKGSSQAKGTAPSDPRSSAYDADPRVRTGAYRIVGVAQIVTVKDGQSLASLSRLYLGPGMECYVEAVNGKNEVKVGQKIKIPKLELKRKKK